MFRFLKYVRHYYRYGQVVHERGYNTVEDTFGIINYN